MNHNIIWPQDMTPAKSPVFVHNEIMIDAIPERVWFWLTNATTWQEWYFNASNVHIIGQADTHLQSGTQFT